MTRRIGSGSKGQNNFARVSGILILALLMNACGGSSSPSAQTSTYSVGGSVSGLAGNGMVLQNNGSDDLSRSANGAFSFATAIASGVNYSVTIKTQPTGPSQSCMVANGAGVVSSANITNVAISCTTNTYTIGGSVNGLIGSGLVLQDNGGNDISLNSNAAFTFSAAIASGSGYAVTVKTQPTAPAQTCTVGNAAGTVTSANITNVAVNCITNAYSVGGNVTGLAGSGLVLQNNGFIDLPRSANGTFTFPTIASGSSYSVTVKTQPTSPSQTCVVANDYGIVGSANITNVAVSCTTNTYSVGGSIAGLVGSGLVLQDNGGNDLPRNANGAFTFSNVLTSGSNYTVTVKTQPSSPTQTCVLSRATGTVTSTNITNVAITCTTKPGRFLYVGSTAGLSCFAVNAITGALTYLKDDSACAVGYNSFVTTHPSGKFLYLAIPSNQIRGYSIDQQTGLLSSIPGAQLAGGNVPISIAVDPSGQFVFMPSYAGGVHAYSVNNATGDLALVAGSPFDAGGPNRGTNWTVAHPSGQFLYTVEQIANTISAYAISGSGTLSSVSGSPFSGLSQPNTVAIEASGKFIYATNELSSTVSAFAINSSTGALTPVSGSPFALPASAGPRGMAIDPTGKYLYTANHVTSSISAFSIDTTTGALSLLSTYTITGITWPQTLIVHPSGQFLYVGSLKNRTPYISAFTIDPSTGLLTPMVGTPFIDTKIEADGVYSMTFSD